MATINHWVPGGGTSLHEALKLEDFPLPDECTLVEPLLPIDGMIQLRYTVNLRPEQLAAFGRALVRIANQDFEPSKKDG